MSDSESGRAAKRIVTGSEFLSDASAVLQRAEREGPIVVTDDKGSPRMAIHCPREKIPFNVD